VSIFTFEKSETKGADVIEYALVLVTLEKKTWLLHGIGVAVEGDLDAGLDRDEAGPTSLAPEEPGMWVWEGVPRWISGWNYEHGCDEGAEPDYDGGTWRRMTEEEQAKFLSGDLAGMWGASRWPPEVSNETTAPQE
jgi:hypothetical protein